jgi:hypothetical protein
MGSSVSKQLENKPDTPERAKSDNAPKGLPVGPTKAVYFPL